MAKKFTVKHIENDSYRLDYKHKGSKYSTSFNLSDSESENAKTLEAIMNNIIRTGKKTEEEFEVATQ